MSATTPGRATRDYHAEETAREFAGWFEAQAYPSHAVSRDDLADAFAAGMDAARMPGAQRDLDAAQESPALTNRHEASVWLNEVTGSISDGTTDSITPAIASTAVIFALLDIADAIREQANR